MIKVRVEEGRRLWSAWQWALARVRERTGHRLNEIGLFEVDLIPITGGSSLAEGTFAAALVNQIWITKESINTARSGGYFRPWIEDALLHELSHIVRYRQNGKKWEDQQPHHGNEWLKVARKLGCIPLARAHDWERVYYRLAKRERGE